MHGEIEPLIRIDGLPDGTGARCELHPHARVRMWTIGNVVEVTDGDRTVTSHDGTIQWRNHDGDVCVMSTSALYVLAAQRQDLPVEYIESTFES